MHGNSNIKISTLLKFKFKKYVCLIISDISKIIFCARKCSILVKDKTHSSGENNESFISTIK